MKTTVTFIDNIAQIETYDEEYLLNRKTVKSISAMIWMQKQEKDWTWGYDDAGHEKAEAE